MYIRFQRLFFILFSALFLFACSSNKVVKTYEGEVLPESAVAILNAPENITLLSVNERAVDQYLLSNLEVNYALKEGKNAVVFQYESIWSKAKRDEQTGSRVDVVKSQPFMALISAQAGERYTFNFKPASNVREARALVNDFEVQVVDAKNKSVAEVMPLGVYEQEQSLKSAPAINLSLGGEASNTGLSGDAASQLSVLERLKSIWLSTNEEDRKAFLAWVFK